MLKENGNIVIRWGPFEVDKKFWVLTPLIDLTKYN